MSTVYTGIPANVTSPLAATVSTTTGNGVSPIVITTAANHLYATGDVVTVSGVVGNTAANTTATIVVIGSTTFSLTGTTGNGAYVSGGACSNRSLTPQFTIPSDGDAFNVASVNVAIQSLADRTQFLATALIERVDVITSNKTWTPGANTTNVRVRGYGGGGGGGGGAGSNTTVTRWVAGGGGGGGAQLIEQVPPSIVAGTGYAVVPGTGGTGGTAGAAGTTMSGEGGDGGSSTFGGVLTFPGGGGGGAAGSVSASTSATIGAFAAAGQTTAVSTKSTGFQLVGFPQTNGPGAGGFGSSAASNTYGVFGTSPASLTGAGPVVSGFGGLDSSTMRGGGPGGSGGSGPGGAGASGGSGGAGNSAGIGVAGGVGGAGGANTGAGGSGGGAAGHGTTGNVGGAGGAGGSGQITIYYRGPQATIT